MCVEMNMLAEIDISEATSSEAARQTIVAKLLTCAVFHLRTPVYYPLHLE
jgi:hypothetical protein